MNDDTTIPLSINPQPTADPALGSDPQVDEIVRQGSEIQDLFQANDLLGVSDKNQVSDDGFQGSGDQNQVLGDSGQQPVSDDVVTEPGEKSPLELLEEILSSDQSEQKQADEAEMQAKIAAENARQQLVIQQAQIEEQRQKLMAEQGSQEQQQRDQIRQQQMDQLKTKNPFEIRQLQRSKAGK